MRRLGVVGLVVIAGALLAGTAQAQKGRLTTARARAALVRYGRLDNPLSVHVGRIIRIDRQTVEAIIIEYGTPIGRDPSTGAIIRAPTGIEYVVVAVLLPVQRSPEARRYDPYNILVYTYRMRGSEYYERF